MQQKMKIAGVINRAGTARKTGNHYSMFTANVMEVPLIEGNVAQAIGYSIREFDCTEQAFNQLRNSQFPVDCECHMQIGWNNKVLIDSVRVAAVSESRKAS